jgi:hypothetical protein
LGEPRPAAGTTIQSTNLVANSVMIIESTQLNQETVPASLLEPTQILSEPQTSSSIIPVSPTR